MRALFFASCREAVGSREIELEVRPGTSVGGLLSELVARYPELTAVSGCLQTAVNATYADRDATLRDGDEVALIPPVSGGASFRDVCRIVEGDIAPGEAHELVRSPTDGAVVTFSGVVRNHFGEKPTSHLVYEAYEPMAEKQMGAIAQEARERWPIGDVAIIHRVGRLEIGEISVLIAVASPHRAEAFDACRYIIDRLKQVVPIWKKEVGPDGEYWVEGPPILSANTSIGP